MERKPVSTLSHLDHVRRARRLLDELLHDGVIRHDEYVRLLRGATVDEVVRPSRIAVTAATMRLTLDRLLVAIDAMQLRRDHEYVEHRGLVALGTEPLFNYLLQQWQTHPASGRVVFRQLHAARPEVVRAVNQRVCFSSALDRRRCVLLDIARAREFVAEAMTSPETPELAGTPCIGAHPASEVAEPGRRNDAQT